MPEYKTHSFNKDWHDKVEKFLEENDDLAFDSPKYFIKYCVNKFMEEHNESIDSDELEQLKENISKALADLEDKE